MPTGWDVLPRTSLLVPGDIVEHLMTKAKELRKAEKRAFFSDRGKLGRNNGNGGSDTSLTPWRAPTADPMQSLMFTPFYQYQPWNMAGTFGKPTDSVPFSVLRGVADRSVIDRLILDTRMTQVRAWADYQPFPTKTKVGWRVAHEQHEDPNFEETDDIKKRCREVEERILNLTPAIHPGGFRTWMSEVCEEILVVDRLASIIWRDGRGRPERHNLADGTTIKPRLEALMPWMRKNHIYNEDIAAAVISSQLWSQKKIDIDLTDAAYVQEVEGQLVAAWSAEQMSVGVFNPRVRLNTLGYGYSPVEKSLEATRAFVFAWQYNVELFRTNYPEAILALLGEYDEEGLEAFKRQLYTEVGPGGNWRLPVIPGGTSDQFKVQVEKLRDSPQEMLFGDLIRMMVTMKCGYFRMHPTEISFSGDMGSQSTIFGREDQEEVIAKAAEQGLHGLLDDIKDYIDRTIVKPNYDDLELYWVGRDRQDQSTLIANLSAETAAYKLVSEARAEAGLPAVEGTDYINNPLWFQQKQMAAQEEQMAQQKQQYDQGDFGSAPQGEGEPQEAGGDTVPQQWLEGATASAKAGKDKMVKQGGGDEAEQEAHPGMEPDEEQAPVKKSLLTAREYAEWQRDLEASLPPKSRLAKNLRRKRLRDDPELLKAIAAGRRLEMDLASERAARATDKSTATRRERKLLIQMLDVGE